jgi:hypothetical protein
MFGFVNFRINRVLQNTRQGGGGSEIPARSRSQIGVGNNVNKHSVNSFLKAASAVLVYSCVMYCTAFPVF